MNTISIRIRLIVLTALGGLLCGLVGLAGYRGLSDARSNSDLLEDSAAAVRASMNADMKHDNTRAEIMRAALAGSTNDVAQMAEVQNAVTGNVKALMDSLDTAVAKAPTPASRAAMQAALPVAQRYRDAALAAAASIQKNPQGASQVLTEFDKAFHELEAALEKTGDAMEQAAGQVAQATHDASDRSLRWMMGTAVVGVVALLLLSAVVIRSIVHPLHGLSESVRQLNRDDGDLSRRLSTDSVVEFSNVARQFNAFLDKVVGIVGNVQASAHDISTASAEIAAGNQELSKRTEETASNLQQAASSVEQITATVHQSAEAARQANELAASASAVATRGGAAVSRVVSTMDEINVASRRIGDIIGVIDGIAFQTNILALNAAVEAARAGEQGRGFAVVASEVRTLAQRSAAAAHEIKELIGTSVQKVEAGGQYVKDAGATMSEIVASVNRVSTMIGEITNAAVEQSAGIALVNETVNNLDRTTQHNAALVEQTAAAAGQMAQQARMLDESVGVFRTVTA